jgi:hypothetical protein
MDTVTVSPEAIGGLSLAVVAAISALIRALVPPSKMPRWLGAILDIAGGNWGHAKNAAVVEAQK